MREDNPIKYQGRWDSLRDLTLNFSSYNFLVQVRIIFAHWVLC